MLPLLSIFQSRHKQSPDTSKKKDEPSDGRKELDGILFNDEFWEYARAQTLKVAIPIFTAAYVGGIEAAALISPVLDEVKAEAEFSAGVSGSLAASFGATQSEVAINLAAVETAAADKIATYTNAWWEGIQQTTQTRLRRAIIQLPKIGMQGVIEEARKLFSPERAELIATTETTRLFGAGAIDSYKAAGLASWRWQTVRDSHVDSICTARNGLEFPIDVPFDPAHPRCRCFPRPIVPEPDV